MASLSVSSSFSISETIARALAEWQNRHSITPLPALTNPSSDEPPKPNGAKGVVTGVATGAITSVVVHPVNKLNTRIQVAGQKLSLFVELRRNPFQGVGVALPQTIAQSVILFGTMPYFNQMAGTITTNPWMAKSLVSSAAGMTMGFCMAPVSTIKNRMMASKDKVCALQVLRIMLQNREYIRFWDGSTVVIMRNAVVFPVVYSVSDAMEAAMKATNVAQGEGSKRVRRFTSGMAGALASSLLVYPLDVISTCQKTSPVRMAPLQALRVKMQGGFSGLYKGYWNTSILANLMRGGLFILIPELVEEFYK